MQELEARIHELGKDHELRSHGSSQEQAKMEERLKKSKEKEEKLNAKIKQLETQVQELGDSNEDLKSKWDSSRAKAAAQKMEIDQLRQENMGI